MKKSVKAFLDRIEGDIAVIYLGSKNDFKLDIPLKFLPKGIKENTNIKIDFSINQDDNKKNESNIDDLRKKLLENS
ncbi:MAG: DUF3006 domain-containing protein [Candidatus Sericytochromatia bacterium]